MNIFIIRCDLGGWQEGASLLFHLSQWSLCLSLRSRISIHPSLYFHRAGLALFCCLKIPPLSLSLFFFSTWNYLWLLFSLHRKKTHRKNKKKEKRQDFHGVIFFFSQSKERKRSERSITDPRRAHEETNQNVRKERAKKWQRRKKKKRGRGTSSKKGTPFRFLLLFSS